MKILLRLFLLMALLGISSNASATILGSRYFSLNVGQVSPGDDFLKNIDDSVLNYGANIRIPIDELLDCVLVFSQSKIDGELTGRGINVDGTETSFGVVLQKHFKPQNTSNPFISIGALGARTKLRLGREEIGDTSIGLGVGGGVEFDLWDWFVGREISAVIGAKYYTLGDQDLVAGFDVYYRAATRILLSLGMQYAFDAGARKIHAGVGIGF